MGSSHLRSVVVQTSMNLTQFAVKGQWNQATAIRSNTGVNADFQTIFNQSKPTAAAGAYRRVVRGFVTDIFFPKGGAADPVGGVW